MDVPLLAKVPSALWRIVPSAARPYVSLLATVFARWLNDGGPQLGASIAFYAMFAMAPLLIIAIAVAGAVFGLDAARGQIVGQIRGLIGTEEAKAIEGLIESAWRHPHGLGAGIVAGITLLVGATGVFTELRRALNTIGHVPPHPSALGALVKARLTGLALVLGFGFLAIASLLLSTVLNAFSHLLIRGHLSLLLHLLDMMVSTMVLTTAFASLLRWLPDTPPSWPAVWLGAAACSLLFSSGKYLISLYLAQVSVASSYGAAGSFVVIMLWVYYSAQILLFGGALTASWEARNKHKLNSRPNPRLLRGGDETA